MIQVVREKTLCSKGYTSIERYFYMKIIVTVIPTDVVTNLPLFSFCPLLQTKIKNHVECNILFL